MSEFWVSKKKYRCQYCDIFITDDAPSRQQHENGLRHKGSRERFIRSLYKTGERAVKEKEEERREMAAIERAANAAFALDVGRGAASQSALPTPAAASTSTKPKPPLAAPVNRLANYTTAADLGYTDPDLERALLEAELRRSEGRAGEWTVVMPQPVQAIEEVGGKRRWDGEEEDGGRAYRVKRKTVAVGLGELWDPGEIRVKVKQPEPDPESVKKEEEKVESELVKKEEVKVHVKEEDTDRGLKPRWAKTWSTVDEEAEAERILEEQARQEERFGVLDEPKAEEDVDGVKKEEEEEKEARAKEEVVPEPEEVPGAGMFKKRKPPAGLKAGRRRP